MIKADAIIVAAGSGSRFGAPKQLAALDGIPVYQHCLKTFAEHPHIDRIVLVVASDHITQIENEIGTAFYGKKIELAIGGATRQDSVSNGMQKLEELGNPGIILIHDAARPFVTVELITNVTKAAQDHTAALAAIPITDTLKQSEHGYAIASIPRTNLWRAQTPQSVRFDLLKQALENAYAENYSATDEAELLERIGVKPYLVMGDEKNMKITYKQDLKSNDYRL